MIQRGIRVCSSLLAVAIALAWIVAPVMSAVAHELQPGDKLELRIDRVLPQPAQLTVGGSGGIRVPLLDRVAVAGLTPTEATERLNELYVERGLLVAPYINLSLLRTRPVFVTGDVREPGAYDHANGLTVQQAVALAGGLVNPLFPSDPATMASDALADRAAAQAEIVSAELDIARHAAMLSGASSLEYSPSEPPQMAPSALEGIVAAASQQLQIERNLLREELTQIRSQIEDASEEIVAMKARRDELDLLIAIEEEEVERLSSLRDSGYGTTRTLTQAQRQLSMTRSLRLEQDTRLAQAMRQRTELLRAQTRLRADTKAQAAAGVAESRVRAEIARARWVAAGARLARAGELQSAQRTATMGPRARYALRRSAGASVRWVEPATPVKPGDTIEVDIERAGVAIVWPASSERSLQPSAE